MGRLGLHVVALAMLSGCLEGDYGTAVPYPPHVELKVATRMPPNAPRISQQFMPFTRDGQPGHMGLDVAAPTGTPVLAAAPGRVSSSRFEPVYGNRIVVEHGTDGTGRKVQTLYFHLATRGVAVGERVARGQQIGTLGATGLLSSYPHLHFEYHRELTPGSRVQTGDNWWQGIVQEDPNLNWVDGPGRVACYARQRAPADKITYPVACAGR